MRSIHACVFATILLTAPLAAQETSQHDDAALPIRRITLYTSGVGFYQHRGELPDSGRVEVTFEQDQINDVLKSLRVWGGQEGAVPRVTYPVKQPLARQLASFGVNLAGDTSLHALLEQLRGATVTVTTPQPVTGRVLDVTARTRVIGEPPAQVTEYLLVLVTDDGLRSIPLDTLGAIEIEDAKLRDELAQALSVLAESRDQRTKKVTIDFGDGEPASAGGAGLSYLIEAPVWKTSYRLDLAGLAGDAQRPTDGDTEADAEADTDTEKTAQLQGWAIVENVTDRDWENVQLTLISGRPISFVMDLSTPLYLERPVVKPELYASLRPRRYAGGFGGEAADADRKPVVAAGRLDRRRRTARSVRSNAAGEALVAQDALAPTAAPQFQLQQTMGLKASAVQSAASVGNVGELFRYTLDKPISIDRQRSAMLPILAAPVQAEKLSIYNQQTHATHPLRGARLTNSTDLKLMAGPITLYDDGRYVGDALIPFMGPDDERLLSYAIDLEMRVDPSTKSDSAIVGGKIVRGVLQIQNKHTWTQTYTIKNEADQDRTLIVEHPRQPSRDLVQPEDYAERTEQVYRFRVEAPAGETVKFPVKEAQVNWQRISIIGHDPGDLLTYVRTDAIDAEVREALAKAIALKQKEAALRRQIESLEHADQQIAKDQDRIRDNMRQLDRQSALYQRYVQKLADQETRLEELRTRKLDLTEQADQTQRELADYLSTLTIGGEE